MKKAGDNTIWLDIETGGTNPAQSSILSAAWGKTGNIKSHFAAPIEGSFLSEFSEKNIIPQLTSAVKSGKDILEEKQLIETLITELEADKGAAIAGFNIRGFDFGFIQRRARIYGMEARFTAALVGRSYVDPIHQVKNVIASSILEHAEGGLFNQTLGVSSWQEAGEKYADLPFKKRPVEYNLISSIEGYLKSGRDGAQFKGWKLEDVNRLLEVHSGAKTLQGGAAHEAAADLIMSRRVIDATKSGELREALKRPEIASEWLNITKSRGFHQFGGGRLLTQMDIGDLAPGRAETKFIKSNWKLALAAGAGAIIAASIFTAHDDNYNTIEGLPHGNFAQSKRLELTEFGSGYKPKLTLAHIKELATKASKSSVSDFFKSIKVSRPNEAVKSLLDEYGGGLTIDLKQLKRLNSFQPKSLLGFNRVVEKGQPKLNYQTWREQQANLVKSKIRTGSFVNYNAAEQLSEITGAVLPKSFEAIDDIDKIIGFHEAAELQNIRSIPTSILKSELFNGGPAPSHAMSVVQEELFSRSLHPEARDFMRQVRKVSDSWFSGYDDAYNTNEGLRHGGISEQLRKLLTEFGSGWKGASSLRRAERLYKSMIKSTLSEAGHKGKINWMSHVDEDSGEMVLAARNAAGERLMGVQRTFAKESVDLTSIEVAPHLQGGIGRKFYEYENRALKRLGLSGAEVTSPVANPVTGRMQAELYGSKPMSMFNRDIESAYGVDPQEFQQMLMDKRMTKDQWKTMGLAPTFSGRVSAPKVNPIMSGKDDAHNSIEGLGHKGISQKLRKLLTPFGSGWRGMISLSSKMDLGRFQKASGLVSDVGTLQEIWQSNVTRLKGLHGKDWWKTDAGRATHKFGKELIQAKEAGFTHAAGINAEVIRESAKKSNLDFGKMLKHTIEHERVHLGMRLEGTQVSKNLPVPQAFKTEMAKNPAYRDITPEKLAEEYVANLSAVMKYPERAMKDQRVRSSIIGATTEEIARGDIVAKNIASKLKAQRKKNMTAFNQKKALGQTWQAGIDAGRRSKMG